MASDMIPDSAPDMADLLATLDEVAGRLEVKEAGKAASSLVSSASSVDSSSSALAAGYSESAKLSKSAELPESVDEEKTYVALPSESLADDWEPDETWAEELHPATPLSAAEQRYPYDADKAWYVLRATYGRGRQAHDFLGDEVSFFPTRREVVAARKGRKTWKTRAFLPNLIFVYATRSQVEGYVHDTPELSYLSIYYDHFRTNEFGKNHWLTVPYAEMVNFINLMLVGSEHTLLVDPAKCHFKSGQRVRVIAGEFAGVEGRVARIAGQQRVVVSLEGICLAATAYVPTSFLMLVGE